MFDRMRMRCVRKEANRTREPQAFLKLSCRFHLFFDPVHAFPAYTKGASDRRFRTQPGDGIGRASRQPKPTPSNRCRVSFAGDLPQQAKPLILMVDTTGIEPVTPTMST